MKKFTVMILCVSTFFIGLGSLIDSVGARFKSDERALEIMRQARQAIGGEQNLKAMQSLTISGKASKTFEFDNVARIERGDWELNLQLPNKISKRLKIETENIVGNENAQTLDKKVDVVILRKSDGGETENIQAVPTDKVVIVKKGEGGNVITEDVTNTNGEVRKVVVGDRVNAESYHKNELFRTMMALFLTPPNGTDAEYTFVGEQSVDGINCEIVQVNSGNSSIKLFINKSSHLPVMMTFADAKPMIFTFVQKQENSQENQDSKVKINKADLQMAEYQVKFSDYRTVNGLELPFRWTQTVDGKADESIEVSAYELNPANIAEKFKEQQQKIMIRTKKP